MNLIEGKKTDQINVNKGRFWSKKYLVNHQAFNSVPSGFFKKYYITSVAVNQLGSMFLKNGARHVIRKELLFFLKKPLKKKKINYLNRKKKRFIVKKKNPLAKVGKIILKYRVFGHIKKRYVRRRTINYSAYLTRYNQWRRTIRFLGVFFKKRGVFREKFEKEISKLTSKNFHYRRDAILHRTNRLLSGLTLKYTTSFAAQRDVFFHLEGSFFAQKYIKYYLDKYIRNFEQDKNFLKRSHPKSTK